jgi:hypothetical protein
MADENKWNISLLFFYGRRKGKGKDGRKHHRPNDIYK